MCIIRVWSVYICDIGGLFISSVTDMEFEEDSEGFLEPGELDLGDDDFEAELGSAATVCRISS